MKFVVAFRELPDWMFEKIFLLVLQCLFVDFAAIPRHAPASPWADAHIEDQADADESCQESGLFSLQYGVPPLPSELATHSDSLKGISIIENLQTAKLARQGTCCNHPSQMFPHSATPIEVQFHVPSQFSQVLSNARLGFWSLSPTVEDPAWGASKVLGLGLGLELKHGWKNKIWKLFHEDISIFSLDMQRIFIFFHSVKKNVKRVSGINSCLAKSFSQCTSDFWGSPVTFSRLNFWIWKVNFLISFILIKANIFKYSKNKYICDTIFFLFFYFLILIIFFFNFWNYF